MSLIHFFRTTTGAAVAALKTMSSPFSSGSSRVVSAAEVAELASATGIIYYNDR